MHVLLRLFLILVAMLCGFAMAAMIGANFLVSRESGLAGATEVLFYGIAGAILMGLAAGYVIFRLGQKTLAWVSLLAALLLGALIAMAFWNQREELEYMPPSPVTQTGPEGPP